MSKEKEFDVKDGELLIKFARENIEHYLTSSKRMEVPSTIKSKYSDKYGVFVTLNDYKADGNPLRGCIGYIEPNYPLYEVIHRVSVSSAVDDYRFNSVSLSDMDNIIIEISILTPPKLIEVTNPNDYFEKIEIGRDGLIAEKGMKRGLLLPQVPIDHGRNWDIDTFLKHTCNKAGLSENAWKDKQTKIYSFQAILFEELKPRGEVMRKYLV